VGKSTVLPNQVLVSDDSDNGQITEELVARFPFATYQRGPRTGLGANRNTCVERVTSTRIVFIDDDVIIPPDFISSVLEICQAHSGSELPPIISGIEFKRSGNESLRIEPHNPDFWGFQKLPPKGWYSAIVINATVFPSELFLKARFDPHLKYGSEEVDMARHAVSLGYRIFLEPSLFVHHYPSEINRGEYQNLVDASRMYSTAKAYLRYQRKPMKAFCYVMLAPVKELFSKARRTGFHGARGAIRATYIAAQYSIDALANSDSLYM
jgi:glycosyltransferase involved in cell wall biosynthesis